MIDDTELLQRYARARDEQAFGELVRRHLSFVYRTAARQLDGDEHRAQDVAQVVFALVARRSAVLSAHHCFAGWLHTTTCHTVRNLRRQEQRRRIREEAAMKMHDDATDPTPALAVDTERLRAGLDEAMSRLNAADREAILLRFFQGRPFAEIGRTLRLSEDAARMRVARALDRLRLVLTRRGVTSTSAALGGLLASEGAMAAPADLAPIVAGAALMGSGTITTGGLLAFMSTTKVVSTVVALAVMLALGTLFVERQRALGAHAALAAAQRDEEALRARVAQAEQQARAARGEVIAAQESLGRVRLTTSSDANEAGRAFLAAHPELARALKDQRRASIAGQYFVLWRELGLTEAQIVEFEQIVLDGPESAMIVGTPDGSGWGWIALRPGEGRTAHETSQRLLQLLGREGYEKLMSGVFAVAGSSQAEIASALYFTNDPLSAEQAKKLARAILEEDQGLPRGQPRPTPALYWAGVAERAREFLTPRQVEALTLRRAREEYQLAQQNAAKASALPPPHR
jgi:RNA polymerase sigma factor (sigma-70 family)